MGTLMFTHGMFISVSWGLLLMYAAAERQYFTSSHNATWEQARNHCQICFKEMVTLTPQNAHIVAHMVDSDHWIGLRKYINYNGTYNDTGDYDYDDGDYYTEPGSFTNASSKSFGTPWTRWADGDPLVFQNWYPGYPVFKSPVPKIDCCSCSCTCPVPSTTPMSPTTIVTTTRPPTTPSVTEGKSTGPNVTEDWYTGYDVSENITDSNNLSTTSTFWESTTVHTTDSPWRTTPLLPMFSTCERSPMLTPVIPENNKNYIENSCVVMLGFGPWVERLCLEQLPFICYEDRFMGNINISDIESSSAFLQWDQGPGSISHYRLEVSSKGLWNFRADLLNVSYTLQSLTPGTGYKVQVFPVKCDRDLNPQNSMFYTIPGEVSNLTVIGFEETYVNMTWKKPDGNYGFFKVTAKSQVAKADPITRKVTTEHMMFDGVIQGNMYQFVFTTVVQDESMWSKNISTLACTRPDKVSKLEAFNNSDTYLFLRWEPPKGSFTRFKVKVMNGTMEKLNATVSFINDNQVNVSSLPIGKQINLSVITFSNCSLEGEHELESKAESNVTYTAPAQIPNLDLYAKQDSIEAKWNTPSDAGDGLTFEAQICSDDHNVEEKKKHTPEKNVTFNNLKTATKYTVKVFAILNGLKSPVKEAFKFTSPSSPTEIKVDKKTKDSLTFTWKKPENSSATDYNCSITSDFWNTSIEHQVNETKCTFSDLKSGSTYNFSVYTVSNNTKSASAEKSGQTEEEKVDLTLSMICTSQIPLYCDNTTTRLNVFNMLERHFNNSLGGKVYFEIKKNKDEQSRFYALTRH